MKIPDIPCTQHCSGRTPGCHGSCEAYLAFRSRRDAENRAKLLRSSADCVWCDNMDRIRKITNRRSK